jgi:hypothetical protein
MSYAVFTMFKTAPDYRDEAISIINQLKEITLANGATGARIGMLGSGNNVGKLVVLQFFENMGDIESAYDALLESPLLKKAQESGKFSILYREVQKVVYDFGTHLSAQAKYVVLTIGTADDPALDTISKFADVLTSNGAVSGRYGTFVLGDRADGKTHLFGSSYPSLGAVQSAYDAAADSGIAAELYKLVSVEKRQLIRLFN